MFRFTIRDVLWLTALAAALVAWQVDRWWLVEEHSQDMGAISFDLMGTDFIMERGRDGRWHVSKLLQN